MRLIDADELKTHKVYSRDLAEKVVSVAHIDWAKTIEAEPVRHGKWIDTGNGYNICSNYGGSDLFLNCPHCNCKMDLEV